MQIRLKLTPTQAYMRKQRIWRLYCDWSKRIRRVFFPDTGGISIYAHNWYRCGKDPEKAKLCDWVDESTEARYRRLESIMESRDARREHERHAQQPDFDPLWCPICHPDRNAQ